jgi:FKBP-type peptidyl-prolyl cis-trans isomerase 2
MTLYGLSDNKEQTIVLSPLDAFGVKDDNKTKYVSKDLFPNQEMVKVGNIIELDIKENDGEEATSFAMIKEIKRIKYFLT